MAVISIGDSTQYSNLLNINGLTVLNSNSPANASGNITSISIYAYSTAQTFSVGLFYGSGLTWTVRSQTSVSSTSSGWNTFTVNLSVVTGDVLGIYSSGSLRNVRTSNTGSTVIKAYAGDAFAGGPFYYGADMTGRYSISYYGSGVTTGIKVNNLTVSKWNGIAISKWNGI